MADIVVQSVHMGFLEILADKKIINRYQLNDILAKQKELSGDIDRTLELFKVPADAVRAAKSAFFGIPEISVPEVIESDLLTVIPIDAARNYKFVPVSRADGVLKIGMLDPGNLEARNALQFIASQTNIPFEAYVISYPDFNRVVGMYSGSDFETTSGSDKDREEMSDLEKDSGGSAEVSEGISFDGSFDAPIKKTDEKKIVEDAPATKMIAVILKNAIEGGASDVHIEPTGADVRVRYRVDSVLHVSLRMNKNMHDSLIARLKTMTNTMKLVPASQFEVRSLNGMKVSVTGGYIILRGWGVWDKAANAFVVMNTRGLPSSWDQKQIASLVIAQGLFEGYKLYKAN